MRADESEKHRAELRRQECSRQWAKDDEKLSALQRSVQANDPNRSQLSAVNVTLFHPHRPSLSLRRILRDCSCRSKLPRSQARLFFAVLARDSAAVSQRHLHSLRLAQGRFRVRTARRCQSIPPPEKRWDLLRSI